MLPSWYFDLFCFFAQFLAKNSVPKTLFEHTFTISDVVFNPIWHKLYYQHGVRGWKKIQDNTCWSSDMSPRRNFPILVEIRKNLKHCLVRLEFQCPKHSQIILRLINLASLNVKLFKFGYNNQNLCFWKVFVVYFSLDAHLHIKANRY